MRGLRQRLYRDTEIPHVYTINTLEEFEAPKVMLSRTRAHTHTHTHTHTQDTTFTDVGHFKRSSAAFKMLSHNKTTVAFTSRFPKQQLNTCWLCTHRYSLPYSLSSNLPAHTVDITVSYLFKPSCCKRNNNCTRQPQRFPKIETDRKYVVFCFLNSKLIMQLMQRLRHGCF